jgi:hypothetical protein
MLHASSIRKNADRQTRVIQVLKTQLGASLLIGTKLNPFEGYVASLEKIANGVRLGRSTLPIKANSRNCVHDPFPNVETESVK